MSSRKLENQVAIVTGAGRLSAYSVGKAALWMFTRALFLASQPRYGPTGQSFAINRRLL